VRSYYKSIDYYDRLTEARKQGFEEPPLPPLPADMTQEVSDLYISIYEQITGKEF